MDPMDHEYQQSESSIWTDRRGKKIPISQMNDAYLCNTIRFLRRHVDEFRAVAHEGIWSARYPHMIETNEDAFDRDEAFIWSAPADDFLERYVAQYPYLIEETRLRGLDP